MRLYNLPHIYTYHLDILRRQFCLGAIVVICTWNEKLEIHLISLNVYNED